MESGYIFIQSDNKQANYQKLFVLILQVKIWNKIYKLLNKKKKIMFKLKIKTKLFKNL